MKKLVAGFLCMILCLSFCGCKRNNIQDSYGTVNFYVLDGLSGLPIENVKIVLPESNQTAFTSATGKTDELSVPIVKEEIFAIPRDCGVFSVFAFKEGYNDYALFYAQIKENENRNIKIYLFKLDTPMSNGAPLSIIESPENQWVKDYISKYK